MSKPAVAKKLVRSGADALVIEGHEAGGHIGPVATSVLAQEFLPFSGHQSHGSIRGASGRGGQNQLDRFGWKTLRNHVRRK